VKSGAQVNMTSGGGGTVQTSSGTTATQSGHAWSFGINACNCFHYFL